MRSYSRDIHPLQVLTLSMSELTSPCMFDWAKLVSTVVWSLTGSTRTSSSSEQTSNEVIDRSSHSAPPSTQSQRLVQHSQTNNQEGAPSSHTNTAERCKSLRAMANETRETNVRYRRQLTDCEGVPRIFREAVEYASGSGILQWVDSAGSIAWDWTW